MDLRALLIPLLLLLLPWASAAESAQGAAAAPPPLFSDAEWNRTQAQSTAPNGAPPSSASVAGKAAFGLVTSIGAILAVAAALAYAAKRWGIRRALPGRGRHLEVVETVPLSFKRALVLVRIGDQLLVIGQGEHELHHIAQLPASLLDAPVARAAIHDPVAPPAAQPPAAAPGADFAATLARLIGKRS
jgi:flagellar biosynthetic protein FliO